MPFGKTSQNPVPKPFMAKKHEGMGNHKTVLHSHAAVRGNTSLGTAPTNQPKTSMGKSAKGKAAS